jgi:4-aminobutyrate aminotransferase
VSRTAEVLQRDAALISDAAKLRFYPLALERGEGTQVFDVDGKRYLDFGAGWSVANLGYRHPGFVQALQRQLDKTSFASLISGTHEPALDLAERLIQLTPGDFEKKVWFGFAGSDANETVANLLPRATGRRRFVSFIGGYHGATVTTMNLSAHVAFSDAVGGGNVLKVPYPNPYRCPFGGDGTDTSERCLRFLEEYLFRTICPPADVAGVFVEALQSDGGDILPPPDFLPGLEALCRRHGIPLVLDEVKVGMGRTGRLFAFEHSGVTPDVVVLGKALGGGLPVSAIVGRKDLLDSGFALFTAVGNPLGCSAASAVLDALESENLIENARAVGEKLHQGLIGLQGKHEIIGDVRGLGLMQGVELVRERRGKEPADKEAAKVVYRAFELGLLLFYVGMTSNVLEITPPLIVTQAEIEEGISLLDQAFADVADGLVPDEAVSAYAGW